jgi:hypothetical protein
MGSASVWQCRILAGIACSAFSPFDVGTSPYCQQLSACGTPSEPCSDEELLACD